MKSIFFKALQEAQDRRIATYKEFRELAEVTHKAMQGSDLTKEDILAELEKDIVTMKGLNDIFKKDDPFPLRYNKLAHLLEGAQILIEQHYDSIINKNYDFLPESDNPYDPKINTSILNYAQTALLEILSIIRKQPIDKISDLQEAKIYDINLSPNIQGIKTADASQLDFIAEWRWCGKDPNKEYHELLAPGLGYYFGGSRYDKSYDEKVHRQEDCSSIVAKWIGADEKTFTTTNILNIVKDETMLAPHDLGEGKKLSVIGEDREPMAGDIFAFRGHCGMVMQYSDAEGGPLSVLNCNRSMPYFEGLISQEYVLNGLKARINWENLASLASVRPYDGLDTAIENYCLMNDSDEWEYCKVVGDLPDIHYFEVISSPSD